MQRARHGDQQGLVGGGEPARLGGPADQHDAVDLDGLAAGDDQASRRRDRQQGRAAGRGCRAARGRTRHRRRRTGCRRRGRRLPTAAGRRARTPGAARTAAGAAPARRARARPAGTAAPGGTAGAAGTPGAHRVGGRGRRSGGREVGVRLGVDARVGLVERRRLAVGAVGQLDELGRDVLGRDLGRLVGQRCGQGVGRLVEGQPGRRRRGSGLAAQPGVGAGRDGRRLVGDRLLDPDLGLRPVVEDLLVGRLDVDDGGRQHVLGHGRCAHRPVGRCGLGRHGLVGRRRGLVGRHAGSSTTSTCGSTSARRAARRTGGGRRGRRAPGRRGSPGRRARGRRSAWRRRPRRRW